MGLLDSLSFNPQDDTIQGLLARLMPSATAQIGQSQGLDPSQSQQAQPSQASPFDSSMFNPSTYAPSGPPPGGTPFYGQSQNMAVGNYQMPVFGSSSDPQQPQQAQGQPQAPPAQPSPMNANAQMPTDISAQSRQPQQQTLPPALGGQQGGGFMSNLSSGLQSIGNGGSILGVLTGNSTDPVSIQQQNLSAQFNALQQTLRASGLSPQEANSKAMLAVMNPEAGKTILQEALTNKEKYGIISENPVEGKKYGFINERDQTINGNPIGQGGGQSSAGGLLAQGATYDPNRTGEDYLNQFSPDVKAAVKAYINGDVMPSGNPRQQTIAAQAKTIAQKYGQDMGIPVGDALYSEKRKYRTELGTNSPNSAGGQAKAFNQGISHMSALADNLEKLDNSNGFGVPMIANAVNAVRQGASVQQSAISDEAKSLGQTVAGEVGKLFSGSAGGGVHERELTRDRFDTVKSKPQLAAALRATLETMDGGLQALEQRRDSILGPNSGVDLVSDATKANIAKIQDTIDRLEGKSSAPVAPDGAAAALKSNPSLAAQFDAKYGAGASKKVLGK